MEKFIFLLPFGGALTARLAYRRWWAWVVWLASGLTTFLVVWLTGSTGPLALDQVFGAVAGASFLGFIAPELWQALQAFLRRPRNLGYLLAGGMVIYCLSNPELLGSLMTLGIVILGLWIIIRPLFLRGGRR